MCRPLTASGARGDGGAELVYFYAAGDRKPKLLWRFETGSLAYSCGLKSLAVKGRVVAVEVFRKCGLDGVSLVGGDEPAPKEYHSKFSARSFTRFLFEFDGRRFALKERGEVSPSPRENVMNYSAPVSIGDE